jgi:hypothetical protein
MLWLKLASADKLAKLSAARTLNGYLIPLFLSTARWLIIVPPLTRNSPGKKKKDGGRLKSEKIKARAKERQERERNRRTKFAGLLRLCYSLLSRCESKHYLARLRATCPFPLENFCPTQLPR